MSEVAVPEPLSGTEIIDAIVHKVRQALSRDCYLNPNAAYEHFSGKIHIEIAAVDCGRQAGVTVDIPLDLVAPLQEGQGTVQAKSDTTIEKQPPNLVRKETHQPIPVMTEDGSGKKEIKRVQYQNNSKKPDPRAVGKEKVS